MGTARSVGSLFIDIEARTAKIEQDLARVKTQLDGIGATVSNQATIWGQSTSQIENKLARFGLLLVGARSLVTLLAHEFRYVTENIEKIPGLPPDLVNQIQNMRHDLESARQGFRVDIAEAEAFLYRAAKLLGGLPAVAIETFKGHGHEAAQALDEVVNGPKKLTPDQLARDTNPNFDRQLAEAKEVLRHETEMAAKATEDEVHQIISLRIEAQHLRDETKDVMGLDMNSLELTQKKVAALHLEEQASSKLVSMRHQLKEAEDHVLRTLEKSAMVTLSVGETVEAYRQKVWKLRRELTQLDGAYVGDKDNPMYIQKKLELTKQLATAQEGLNAGLKKQGELARDLGTAFAEDFGEAITKGEGLHSLLSKLLQDLIRIVIQRTVTKPLGDLITSGIGMLLGGHAMGGPINGATWVGETGPELLLPSGAGTIIPNEQLGRYGGGSGTWNINVPPGASPADIYRLEQTVMRLAGPGVVERRALLATVSAGNRGGANARALGLR